MLSTGSRKSKYISGIIPSGDSFLTRFHSCCSFDDRLDWDAEMVECQDSQDGKYTEGEKERLLRECRCGLRF